jgi:hypothetical protein
MATTQTPPPAAPTVTFRVCLPEPRDDDDRPQPPRRPDRDLPPETELQRWLDLSG